MLSNQGHAATATKILASASCANTAAATSGWVSIAEYEGDLVFVENVGTVTGGTLDGKIRHADDGSGTNAADVSGATFTQAGTATDERTEKLVVNANKLKPYVQYVGTIATGPAVVGVAMLAAKKYNI